MLDILRGGCAEVARWFAVRAERLANEIIKEAAVEARKLNASSEWWHDVALWMDGADTWAGLKSRRSRRLRRTSTTQARRPL